MRPILSRLFPDTWQKLSQASEDFRPILKRAQKQAGASDFQWYPYDSLSGFSHLNALLQPRSSDPELASLDALTAGKPILDIGCADGATSFLLASMGYDVDAIDNERTNFNAMRGVHALNGVFEKQIRIHSIDLDRQFTLPRDQYGLTLFLGLLYHLKNPFFILETLAKHTSFCYLSTRVTKWDASKKQVIEHLPLAYLVGSEETNNDDTNYWIFTRAGLHRLFSRTGWQIVRYMHTGNTADSDPASAEGDERAFCLLRSIFV